MISMMSLNNKLYKKVIRYLYTGENCGRQRVAEVKLER